MCGTGRVDNEGSIIDFEKPEPRQVPREVPSYVQTCHLCKKEIPPQMVQQGGLHMHCHNEEIDVWFVSLPDAPKHGYYENDVREVAAMLESAEDAYLIERQNMIAGRYYNLKEFEGF